MVVARKKSPKPEEILEAMDAVFRKRAELYEKFVDSIQGYDPLRKAEAWLSYFAQNIDCYGDQEALVYLVSCGHDCSKEVERLILEWKAAAQRTIEEFAAGIPMVNLGTGKTKRVGQISLEEASDVQRHSPFVLRDFWHGFGHQEGTIEATMLRTVEWCAIGGFDDWWERLAKIHTEGILRYGVEPLPFSLWLFNMLRSDYAISLMRKALERGLEAIEVSSEREIAPWKMLREKIIRGVRKSRFAESTLYASTIVFGRIRLRGGQHEASLLDKAVKALLRLQTLKGGWPFWSDQKLLSIEATAMAVHSLALAKPRGWIGAAKLASKWLWSVQERSGRWFEDACPDSVYLTVLVLDAVELANGGTKVTFSLPCQASGTTKSRPRFKVALSFPGEVRPRVEGIAEELKKRLGQHRVFYDKYYQAELARPDLDLYLQSVYQEESELVVVFCCADYARKEWCGLEWRAVRELIKRREPERIMLLRLDDTTIPGLLSIDGYIDIRSTDDRKVAELICSRLQPN